MSSWNRLSLRAIPLVVIVSAVSCGAPNSTILHEAAAYIHVTAGLWVEHARLPKVVTRLPRGLGVFTSLGERTAARLIFLFDFNNLAGVLIPTLAIAQ